MSNPPDDALKAAAIALSEAVERLDSLGCPLAKSSLGFEACPKCGAGPDQNCGRWVSEVSRLESAVRDFLNAARAEGPQTEAQKVTEEDLAWLREKLEGFRCPALGLSPERVKSNNDQNDRIDRLIAALGEG